MTTTNVSNGTAEYQQDTTNMQPGQYNVNASYTGTNIYTNAENNSRLTINNPHIVVINCQSTEEFMYAPDGGSYTQCTNNLDQTGYITNMPNNFVACKQKLQKNMTITGTIRTNNSKNMGWGLQYIDHIRYFLFTYPSNSTVLDETNPQGTTNLTNAISLTANTDITFTISIDNDGYINYTDSVGNNLTSNPVYTDEQLQNMYFLWRHWSGSGRIILKQLTYNYNPGGTI